ncbi:uncharacterized protein N7496_010599 [Penicillium cataractarum]|uniref:Uncharacterized protein n=1 Tax=Penicillium cataractarum TaxID=2100454 RepID=A0A9W9V3I1_9EURO|nr:uncharacterized protein N7496_010599 [Penicillium cataractarum]KAJ5364886.1 hypothetical protein N7496_010599 [Penicillium cataractarum]
MAQWDFKRNDGCIRNVASWDVTSPQNQPYLLQVSWPLEWASLEEKDTITSKANVLYLVDGNAMFLSATEILRRRRLRNPEELATIIIGLSYPLTNSVYSPRRGFDLTPPCNSYNPPKSAHGNPQPQAYGGADIFLDFITNTIHNYVFMNLFPRVSIQQKGLFGHSYGGLFALHTLYTMPVSFDVYLAVSPSIWWNDNFILQEERQFYRLPRQAHRPGVWMAYGSLEESPQSEIDQSDENLDGRARLRKGRRMGRNCEEMARRLEECGQVGVVKMRRYEDEDHGSVVAGALAGGISFFLDMSEAGVV